MKKSSPIPLETPAATGTTLGLDLGDLRHSLCALDPQGAIIKETTLANDRDSFRRLAAKYPAARVILEVGTQSHWVSRFLTGLGMDVMLANARKLRAIYQSASKDAQILARIDPHRPATALPHQPPLRDRQARPQPARSRATGPGRTLASSPRHRPLARPAPPDATNPSSSGKELPISKAGNAYLRRLLVSCAQYMLGPFGADSDLRRQGLKLAARGGHGAKKKAVIATARKLAVVMQALL